VESTIEESFGEAEIIPRTPLISLCNLLFFSFRIIAIVDILGRSQAVGSGDLQTYENDDVERRAGKGDSAADDRSSTTSSSSSESDAIAQNRPPNGSPEKPPIGSYD
jgi:hypothetical protein